MRALHRTGSLYFGDLKEVVPESTTVLLGSDKSITIENAADGLHRAGWDPLAGFIRDRATLDAAPSTVQPKRALSGDVTSLLVIDLAASCLFAVRMAGDPGHAAGGELIQANGRLFPVGRAPRGLSGPARRKVDPSLAVSSPSVSIAVYAGNATTKRLSDGLDILGHGSFIPVAGYVELATGEAGPLVQWGAPFWFPDFDGFEDWWSYDGEGNKTLSRRMGATPPQWNRPGPAPEWLQKIAA